MRNEPSKKAGAKKAAAKKSSAKKGTAKKAAAKKAASKSAEAQKAKADTTPPPVTDPIAVAFDLIAEHGWAGFDMAGLAEASGHSLGDLTREYGSRQGLLIAFQRQVDLDVLDGTDPEDAMGEETARDLLFDILMRRFDALEPFKPGIERLSVDLIRDPVTSLALAKSLSRSMAWMLAAARLPSDGIRGILNVKGLSAVWLATARVWLKDETSDLSQTMAALDKNLGRAESFANSIPDRFGTGGQ